MPSITQRAELKTKTLMGPLCSVSNEKVAARAIYLFSSLSDWVSVCSTELTEQQCSLGGIHKWRWGVSSVPFPFWFSFHLHFELVSSGISSQSVQNILIWYGTGPNLKKNVVYGCPLSGGSLVLSRWVDFILNTIYQRSNRMWRGVKQRSWDYLWVQ